MKTKTVLKALRGFSHVAFCSGLLLLAGGCASTQYGRVEACKLTDPQLVDELMSVERELGIQSDYRSQLLAIDTSPRPVVTSASTTYSGSFNGQYNNANQLSGNFNGSGNTTYQYTDANGGARFGQGLAFLINASKTAKLENRRKAVLIELSRRREARENRERITREFLAVHPDVAANPDLLTACLLFTEHRTDDPLAQLQDAAEIIRSLPKDRWIGWVEAHGDPHYPYGVVVGSYFMDTAWDGHTLSGKGKSSDGSEMTLAAQKKPDGTLEGTVRSQTMEAKFSGRMTDTVLCVDYKGTESGRPVVGITKAFRRTEMNDFQRVSSSIENTAHSTFSGRYVGNGKSVVNGIEQPYQISMDVSDFGDITFTCTCVVNNQQVAVTGKGNVDSDGNVVVQNEFGEVGHGTISGSVLKAGGENANGSIKSYFAAQKQGENASGFDVSR